jgi:hypothetical protein
MNLPPPLPSQRKKSEWAAILTTLAYPGAGQFLQNRRTAGILLAGITTIVFLWGVEEIFRICFEGYQTAVRSGSWNIRAEIRQLAKPFEMLALCYLVSCLDVVIAHWRIKRAKQQAG